MIGGDVDYGSGPYNVIFPGLETSGQFNVAINDDDVLEGNENFNLTVRALSLPSRVAVGNAQATVVIVDDDGKYII